MSQTPRQPASPRLLKRDQAGAIELVHDRGPRRIRRDTTRAVAVLRWPARWVAANEARALGRLPPSPGWPRLLGWDGRCLERSYIEGAPMHEARPRDPAYFHQARRLLQRMHRHGVAHNDLAKEANWLVTPEGRPALVDFQIAWRGRPRSRFLRLLARQDLRHLLKHKRTYCPQALTPTERRLLARQSWLRQLWFATYKPLYLLIARRVFNWRDNEGRRAQG